MMAQAYLQILGGGKATIECEKVEPLVDIVRCLLRNTHSIRAMVYNNSGVKVYFGNTTFEELDYSGIGLHRSK